ncbi:MAG: hypothetical protein ACI9R3_005813 [Verrucomicrobiales bacterium]|jgi:hypothetical protein
MPDTKYSDWYGAFEPLVISLDAPAIFIFLWAAFVIFPGYFVRNSIALFPYFFALFGYVFAILIILIAISEELLRLHIP